jgi:hypothetical protein
MIVGLVNNLKRCQKNGIQLIRADLLGSGTVTMRYWLIGIMMDMPLGIFEMRMESYVLVLRTFSILLSRL